ncbi:MAG: polymerase lambda [Myxococcaceae bacterium]|nr:polymerase lambda [Myxococcaceae bacterium]
MLDKFAIANALREIGQLLDLKAELGGAPADRFKARAYVGGARAVEQLREDIGELVRAGRLTEAKGIGDALAKHIAELYETGASPLLEKMRSELPPGALELAEVPHLGLRKMRALHEALGIASVAELEAACLAGKVRDVKGFGKKTEQKILQGIAESRQVEERLLLVDAEEVADRLVAFLAEGEGVQHAAIAGDIRRAAETVDGIDVVVTSTDAKSALDRFALFGAVAEVIERGDDFAVARLGGGARARITVAPPDVAGLALFRATGSADHVAEVEALAEESKAVLATTSETALYASLGMQMVAPELREGLGEVAAARKGELVDDLVTLADLQGLVHCHTQYSDGKNTIEEMARAADALGMKYITITDHSPAAHYAGGVEVDRLKRQWDEIDRVQESVKVKILRGTESDILDSGALDYPDAILEKMDVVIASVHSKMKMDEDAMTQRLVAAMRQPVFKIWGHALGRLLQRRAPFACRVEEVLDAVAESRAAIEINGDPYRLDMEPRWIRAARTRDIRFTISTDAHSTRALGNVRFGVGIARRGGVRRGEVLNTLDAQAFAAAVRP